MKKTILLSSLIAITAMAATTGNVKFSTGTESNFEKGKDATNKISETKVSTEVKVKDSGFSFGGEFVLKDVKGFVSAPNFAKATKYSSIFAKYELPEIKGVNSSIKATLKNEAKILNLEGDINTTIEGIKVGVTSNTNFPLNEYKRNSDYGSRADSVHKIYLESKALDGIKANLSIHNQYDKITDTTTVQANLVKAVHDVKGELEVNYNKVKDLKITGKANFVANVKSEKLEYKNNGETLFSVDGKKDKSQAGYGIYYALDTKFVYEGVKDTIIEVNPFAAHIMSKDLEEHTVIYGTNAKVTYKGIENLTLTGRTQLAGLSDILLDSKANNYKFMSHSVMGHFMFGANAKYDYMVNDKFTVSPELDAVTRYYVDEIYLDEEEDLTFAITPKVNAEYKANDNLKLKGGVELPINFKGLEKEDFYKSTNLKTKLNIEYMW